MSKDQRRSISCLSASLLVAGMNIGAGMLTIPSHTARSGFFPSVCSQIICWFVMASLGTLLAEFGLRDKRENGIIPLVHRTFGKKCAHLSGGAYWILFYSLAIAYADGLKRVAQNLFDLPPLTSSLLPTFLCSIIFFLLAKKKCWISWINNILMLTLITLYFSLIGGIREIQPSLILHTCWSLWKESLPIMIGSFAYQFIIPTLNEYCMYQRKKVFSAIWVGTGIPFLVYLLWNLLVLGVLTPEQLLSHPDSVVIPLVQALHQPLLSQLSGFFSLFAIITSLLGLILSFCKFLSTPSSSLPSCKNHSIGKSALFFAPPLLFALFYSNLFLTAFTKYFVGTTLFLFGLLPILACWKKGFQTTNWYHQDVMLFSYLIFLIYSCLQIFLR